MSEVQTLDDLLRSSEPAPTRRKLLVVDDKPEVVDGIRHSRLARPYEILAASNGREGLAQLAQDCEIGVVLLDMLMPVMTGEEFLKALRGAQGGFNKCTRVIVYTAFAGRGVNEADILRSYGPIRFLSKATDPAVVEAEIRNAYTEHDTELSVRLELEKAHQERIAAERSGARVLTLEKTVGGMTHAVLNWLDPVRRYVENAATLLPQGLGQDALGRKLESLDETVAALEERLRAVEGPLTDLVARLSADLTDAYVAYEKLPANQDLLGRLTKALEQLEAASRRIQRIKEYAIVAQEPRTDAVGVHDMCTRVVAPYAEQNPDIAFRVTGDEHATFACAGSQVREALRNLINNAIRAVRESPSKEIGIAHRIRPDLVGDALLLSVSDTGVGIAEEMREKIFQPFVSTHKTEGGSGLGLAYVEQVCLNHGGRIVFESTPGQGATFTMELAHRPPDVAGGEDRPTGDLTRLPPTEGT